MFAVVAAAFPTETAMSRFASGFLGVLFFAGLASAQDQPKDVLQKAIKAHGGEANLKKFPAVEPKLPFTGSVAFSVPDKVRVEMTFEFEGKKANSVQIVNGRKVSQTENGEASKLSDATVAELRESGAIQELSLLYPLLEAKYTLAAGKDATIDGKDCATIVVKSAALKETTLAFDKKSGHLTAMLRKGLNPVQKVVDERTVFSEFKTIEGLVVPMKSVVSHDGRAFLEITVTEYKPMAKLNDKLFLVE